MRSTATTGRTSLEPTTSLRNFKPAELPRSPQVIAFRAPRRHWIHRARHVYRFFDRPIVSLVSYTGLRVLFVSVWLTFLGAISLLALVLR